MDKIHEENELNNQPTNSVKQSPS